MSDNNIDDPDVTFKVVVFIMGLIALLGIGVAYRNPVIGTLAQKVHQPGGIAYIPFGQIKRQEVGSTPEIIYRTKTVPDEWAAWVSFDDNTVIVCPLTRQQFNALKPGDSVKPAMKVYPDTGLYSCTSLKKW